MPEILEPRDYMGKIIKPGCTVVYPVRQSASMWLQHMIVSYIEVIRSSVPIFKIHGTNSVGKLVKLERPERCVITREGV